MRTTPGNVARDKTRRSRQRQSHKQEQRQKQGQERALPAIRANLDAVAAEYDDCLRAAEEMAAPPSDAREPDIDAGESDGRLRNAFDQEWDTSLAVLGRMPRSLSLPIRFWIDRCFEVHGGDMPPSSSDRSGPLPLSALRRAVADAIALHLRLEQSTAPLDAPGSWVDVPLLAPSPGEACTLGGNVLEELKARNTAYLKETAYLIRLVAELHGTDVACEVAHRHRAAMYFKEFAIRLPNDDVVTVKTLIKEARKGKRATRAAALRLLNTKPAQVAGEPWSPADWSGFRKAQANAKGNKA